MDNKSPVFVRKQLLIDQRVQGTLLRRTALYSAGCAIYFIVILFFAETMSRRDDSYAEALIGCLDEAIYWAPGLMLLTPMVAYDLLRVTNRFTGPVFRLRREMHRLANGESEYPLNFRDDDHWKELADVFNLLRTELMDLRSENASLKEGGDPPASTSKLFDEDDEYEVDELDIVSAPQKLSLDAVGSAEPN